jgi:glycine dehydrogenase subunit 1
MVYVPHSKRDFKKMLKACGVDSVDELFSSIPDALVQKAPSKLPEPMSEADVLELARDLADENFPLTCYTSFLGAGLYNHFIPSVVNALLSRGEFLTAYTPYQAEASQGTLQAVYEYQSMIAELTGMDVSNASSYDGGTACADALVMIKEKVGKKRDRILVSEGLHPEYREVMATYNFGLEMQIETFPLKDGLTDYDAIDAAIGDDTAGCFMQYPNCLGLIEDFGRLEKLNEKLHANQAVSVAVCNPIALAILKPPGHLGFDVAVGEGQPLGLPIGFGGPLLGYFATKQEYIRKLPGRLVGRTVDVNGDEGFVLNLQAREQHIRRERATSNICTNEALCALAAAMYMTYWGREGLPLLAKEITGRAHLLAKRISEIGAVELYYPGKPFFNEIVVKVDADLDCVNDDLLDMDYLSGFPLADWFPDSELHDCMLLAVTENLHPEDIKAFCKELEETALDSPMWGDED